MEPLRRSPAYKRILKRGNPMRPFLGECTYDPLPDIDTVWVGLGPEGKAGHGSVVVLGPVERDKVLECYGKNLNSRGLSLSEQQVEGFTVHSGGPGRPHLAWVDRETLLISDRPHIEKMLALEKGKGRSVLTNDVLMSLYKRMAADRDIALAVLPDEASRERVKGFMPSDWQGATAATRLGVGIRVHKGLDLIASLRLPTGLEAEKLSGSLGRALKRWSDHDYVAIAGLSAHMKAIRIEHAGPELIARAEWNEKQVDSLARLAVDSAEEILRGAGNDPAKALRQQLRGAAEAGSSADAGARPRGDGAPADGSIATDASRSNEAGGDT